MSDFSKPASAQHLDTAALAARYREEREKRLRPEGSAQYVLTDGDYAHFMDDPYVEPGFKRSPISQEIEVAVIGGGFGGQLAAVDLQKAGIDDFRILDVAGDFGGTWYWNRYPGAQCDIESYCYLPLLEDMDYFPREKYAHGPEIFAHARAIGQHFGLYEKALFQTEVTKLAWDDEARRWRVSTNHGDDIRARYVVMSVGTLHRPKLPGIEGFKDFQGHSFHTSRWDYGYTGGDASGDMDKLADKRVGIIGTGSTAVQAIPHLARSARHLYVFQRTPTAVGARGNAPTDMDWARTLQPGWQRARMENFNNLLAGVPQSEDLVNDGWTAVIRRLGTLIAASGETAEVAQLRQMADYQQMEDVRARVATIVEHQETAQSLQPWYNQFCKRPTFHDHYLPTFNRPNVTLVDTKGQGVERLTKNGVVANGVEYELDCVVFATGFEFNTQFKHRAGYEIYGRQGLALSDKWSNGVISLRGVHHRDFPNCFILGNSQSSTTPNFLHMLGEVTHHVAQVIRYAKDKGAQVVEPTAESEAAWAQEMLFFSEPMRGYIESCTPGFYNNEGQFSKRAMLDGFWGGGPLLSPVYINRLRTWRETESFDGLVFS